MTWGFTTPTSCAYSPTSTTAACSSTTTTLSSVAGTGARTVATVVAAALTFAGASTVLAGSVSVRLSFVRTYMTQLSVAFSGLVAPAVIGNLALNTRFLQRSGVPPGVAAASVGLAQVAQFCSYVILLLVSGVLAGTGPRASFTPPPALVAALAVSRIPREEVRP